MAHPEVSRNPSPGAESRCSADADPTEKVSVPDLRWWPDRRAATVLLRFHWQRRDQFVWRRLALRIAFLRRGVASQGTVYGNPLQLLRSGRLLIGPRTQMNAGITLIAGPEGRITIGTGVGVNCNTTISAQGHLIVGDDVMIGPGCYITDATHQTRDIRRPVAEQGMRFQGQTVIEDNVWLGSNVVVTGGVRIGRRSIIGANSIVTKDVPPFSLVHGGATNVVRPLPYAPRPRAASDPQNPARRRLGSAVS